MPSHEAITSPPIRQRPDGVWEMTCSGCGCRAITHEAHRWLDPREVDPTRPLTAATAVTCPDCYTPPWRVTYE
jgi:hypothetical protein